MTWYLATSGFYYRTPVGGLAFIPMSDGSKVTLNTDDPGYFISGMMNTMLPPVAATGAFTPQELAQFMINAFDAAWLPRDPRHPHLQPCDEPDPEVAADPETES